jgi:hypothetical protein
VKIESVYTESMLQALAAIATAIRQETEQPDWSSRYPVVASLELDQTTLETELGKASKDLKPFIAVADIRMYDGQEQGPDAEEWHYDDWAGVKFEVTIAKQKLASGRAGYGATATLILTPGQKPVERTERAPDPIKELLQDPKLHITEAE